MSRQRIPAPLFLLLAAVSLFAGRAAAQDCSLSLQYPGFLLTADAGSISFQLIAGAPDCSWTVGEISSGITLTSAASGAGSATISYSYSANTGTSHRDLTVQITSSSGSSVTHDSYQNPPNCTFDLSQPTARTASVGRFAPQAASPAAEGDLTLPKFPISGGETSVLVTPTPSDCGWFVYNPATWITGLPTSAVLQPGYLSFTVAPNDTFDRSAALQMYGGVSSGPFITVSQTGIPQIIRPVSLSPGAVDETYAANFEASGGEGTYVWSAEGLPEGLTLSQSGVLDGTPTAAGSYTVRVTVTDGGGEGNSSTQSFPLTINPALTITGPPALPPGTVAEPYSPVSFTLEGGLSPYTWSATGLPSGLSMNSATGVVSGTPAAGAQGTYQVQIVLSDPGATVRLPLTLIINPPLAITGPTSLPNGAVGEAYPRTPFSSLGGNGTQVWSATGLPAGLAMDQSGAISGTPAAGSQGAYQVNVRLTDGVAVATSTLPLTINPALSITGPATLPRGAVNEAYGPVTFTGAGGLGTYTWSSPNLPAGLVMSPSGVLSGTPAAGSQGSHTITVRLSDPAGIVVTASRPLDINPPLAILTTAIPNGVIHAAYLQTTMQAEGGTPPYRWTAANLPPGLTLSTEGVLSGTATSAGTFSPAITVTDSFSEPQSVRQTFPLTIAEQLVITTTAIPNGVQGKAYAGVTMQAQGGTPRFTWSATGLPAGLAIDPATGTISGTPAVAGPFTATIRVTDVGTPAPQSVAQSFSAIVYTPLVVTTTAVPNRVIRQPYASTLQATGGTTPYSWSLASGSLPDGLVLDRGTGAITGTGATAGTYTFVAKVTDTSVPAQTATQAYTIVIYSTLTMTTSSLPNGTIGTPYSAEFAAEGGASPYSWAIVLGDPPPGLSLNGSGLSGTPAVAGTYTFTLQAGDSGTPTRQLAAKVFTVTIAPSLVILTTSVPTGAVGTAYSASFQADKGQRPYAWSLAAGTLPAGLSLDAAGALTGTPTTGGTYAFTLRVADSSNPPQSVTAKFSATINGSLLITTTSVPNGTVGSSYSVTLAAERGVQPYTWSIAGGSLPAGLSLSAGGAITGTPTTTGAFNFTAKVTDSSNPPLSAAQSYSGTIEQGKLTITTSALPNGTVGTAYSASVAASGGAQPYNWAIDSGSLAPGLSLNATTGAITGTPTTAGPWNVTLRVTDHDSQSATRSFNATIDSSLVITTVLRDGEKGVPYSASLAAQGGQPPYTWALTSGSLPAGLSFSASGASISGTPTDSGSFSITVTVTDAASAKVSKTLSANIGPQPDLSLTGLTPTPQPTTPTNVGVSLASSIAQQLSGSLQLSFHASAASVPEGYHDPALQFASGGTTLPFTIPSGGEDVELPQGGAIQQGTVAGDITVTMNPPLAEPKIVTIPRISPVITANTVRITGVTGSGFSVELTGYSTPRDLASASFTFNAAPGSQVDGASISIDLRDAMTQWYASSDGLANGSLFHIQVPFTLDGDIRAIQSVTVTLTNSVGTSQPVTGGQ